LDNEQQWASVRIIAVSKDGRYFLVDGSVGNERSLNDLRSKLENLPPYIGPAPFHIYWDVQVATNGFPAAISQ
jgi:hypothetical protein